MRRGERRRHFSIGSKIYITGIPASKRLPRFFRIAPIMFRTDVRCRTWKEFVFVFTLSFYVPLSTLHAQTSDYPVFVAQVPNPNDYVLFANSGWDGNWYVGYNNAWIKKLPAIPQGHYARAYIGAKLGRMKTLPPVGRPPEFNPVPGEIWVAIASTPIWTATQRRKLTTTGDIPLDGNAEYALENTGES